ncbi:hypothetical protein T439DRAFT_319848 [Meredithblackwellia eburnea MCA 4105]
MFSKPAATLLVFVLSLSVNTVQAHGTVTEIQGANGITGQGFGIDPSTPRTGSTPKPFEQDTSVIRNNAIASGQTGPCGKTAQSGNLDVAAEMAKSLAAGVPTAAADGTVSLTVHQVNQDGAGPYSCDVSADGTGASFVQMQVTQNVPGRNLPVIGSLSTATATDFPVRAVIPAGTTCTGGGGGVCLVRCRNAAIAGPFGSCAAVAQAGTAAPAAANATKLMTREGREELKLFARSWLQGETVKRSRVAKYLV